VIGANAHPGNPDLMDDKFITGVEMRTDKPPKIEKLDLNSSILVIKWCLILGMVVIGMYG
jgi:hypothetical protein